MAAVANAIRVNFQVQSINGSYKEAVAPGALGIAQQAQGRGGGIQTISKTSETALSFGGITVNGWCFLMNLDATHYVVYGPKNVGGTMEPMGKLMPGEFAWVRIAPSVVLRAKADTADILLDVRIFEN